MTLLDANPAPAEVAKDTLLIDCDVHESWTSHMDVVPYLDPFWQRQFKLYGYKLPTPPRPPVLPPLQHGASRREWDTGQTMGSSLEVMQQHLFEQEKVTHGILDGFYAFSAVKGSYEFMKAFASAYNDWQIAEWLEPEPRLRGSVHVVIHDPEAAAREIDRVGSHPQIVQLFLPTLTDTEFGDPYYRPIFEAALRNDLAVALHHQGCTQTVLGYPRYYVEWHTTAAPLSAVGQLVSLVFNGTFERYPELKVVVLETGVAWLPWFMWRIDEQFRGHRAEVPWVKRLPSEQLRSQLRVATQPLSDITTKQFLQLIEMVESEDMYVFATDYPHYDADSADAVLPSKMPEALRRKIRYENALATYPKLAGLAG